MVAVVEARTDDEARCGGGGARDFVRAASLRNLEAGRAEQQGVQALVRARVARAQIVEPPARVVVARERVHGGHDYERRRRLRGRTGFARQTSWFFASPATTSNRATLTTFRTDV